MHHIRWRKLVAGLLLCLWGIPLSLLAEQTEGLLGDRLILATVDYHSYTQRQLEMIVTLRSLFFAKQGLGQVQMVTASNWTEALATFREQILVIEEFRRSRRLATAPDTLAKMTNEILGMINRSPNLLAYFRRLGADSATILRILSEIVDADVFYRNQVRTLTPVDRSRWLQTVEDHFAVRFYHGANNYQAIYPTGTL